MPDRIATAQDVGRPCPYCRFALKPGVPVHACESCGSVHHAECWADGRGCAVFGCPAATAAAAATQAPPSAPPPRAAPTGYPASPLAPAFAPPPPPPHQEPPRGSGMSPWAIALAAAVVFAGIVLGVAVASGTFSSGGHHTVTVVTVHQAKSAGSATTMTAGEAQRKREAVVGVLDAYQRYYSDRSVSGLGSIFAEGIKRHGLSGSGCSVVEGRRPVLEDYEQQFDAGTGTYTLVGLAPNQVQLSGPNSAEVHSHYEISSGGTGFVNFKLTAAGSEWRISEVYATCA